MADDLAIDVDLAVLERIKGELKGMGAAAPKICANAVNHTLNFGRTLIVKRMSKATTLLPDIIRKRIKTTRARANMGRLAGKLTVLGGDIAAWHFTVHDVSPHGVGIEFLPGVVETREHAFVATMKSGHTGIFQRIPGSGPSGFVRRKPIRERYFSHGLVYLMERTGQIRPTGIEIVDELRAETQRGIDEALAGRK